MDLRRNKKLKTWLAGRACGPGLQGAWGPGPQGLGPGPPGAWDLSNYDFFANLLVGAWRRRGCRLKRLLRRWGPGGKRSRDNPPTPPPPPPTPPFWGCGFSPSPPSATIQHAPQGRRIPLDFLLYPPNDLKTPPNSLWSGSFQN